MHLTETDIALYLDDRFDKDERARVDKHLSDCAACVASVATVAKLNSRSVERSAPEVPREAIRQAEMIVPTPRRAARPRVSNTFRFALGGAAIIVCAVIMIAVFDTPDVSRFRSDEDNTATQLLTPLDASMVNLDDVFRWRSRDEAIAYRFTLFNRTGLPVWEYVASETTLVLPSSLALQSGEQYLWQVESLFPDQSVERSELNAVSFSP